MNYAKSTGPLNTKVTAANGDYRKGARGAQNQFPNKVYPTSPQNSIPNSDNFLDERIEKEYWYRRATDSLCRALEFANSQQHISTIKATADYVTSLSRCLGIDVLKLITESIQEQKGYRP